MKIGIVGLPNVGKSTLFKALTQKDINIANYPFCTIDPNVGIVKVPDERLKKLSRMHSSKETINTVIEFVDIAGLVKGASEGEGLGNQFLSNIQMCDAILHIVRLFENKNIKHVEDTINPQKDIETIENELILKDLTSIETILEKYQRDIKSGKQEIIEKYDFLKDIKENLEKEITVKKFLLNKKLTDNQKAILKELNLLTAKPILYLFNIGENQTKEEAEKKLKGLNIDELPHVTLSNKLELDISELSKEERKELETPDPEINFLIQGAYKILGLITFLTTGPDETRAWTVKKGSTAPQAGAVIHTDFKNKFIRAKVVSYKDLIKYGSITNAQEAGKLRIEGKGYIVQEGDIIEFVV